MLYRILYCWPRIKCFSHNWVIFAYCSCMCKMVAKLIFICEYHPSIWVLCKRCTCTLIRVSWRLRNLADSYYTMWKTVFCRINFFSSSPIGILCVHPHKYQQWWFGILHRFQMFIWTDKEFVVSVMALGCHDTNVSFRNRFAVKFQFHWNISKPA